MKLPESKWSAARYCMFLSLRLLYKCGPPAVWVNAWMGFFGCVNAWKWRKNCMNAWIEKTCVNVKINFLIARMRESALFLREYVNFPFLPDQIFPRYFRKFFPISQKIGFAWMRELRKKNCVNAWILGPLGGLKCLHNKLKSMYIIIRL